MELVDRVPSRSLPNNASSFDDSSNKNAGGIVLAHNPNSGLVVAENTQEPTPFPENTQGRATCFLNDSEAGIVKQSGLRDETKDTAKDLDQKNELERFSNSTGEPRKGTESNGRALENNPDGDIQINLEIAKSQEASLVRHPPQSFEAEDISPKRGTEDQLNSDTYSQSAGELLTAKRGKDPPSKNHIHSTDNIARQGNQENPEIEKSPPAKASQKIIYSNGDVYEGEVVDGERNGFGVYSRVDKNSFGGIVFEGNWCKNQRVGGMKVIAKNGATMEGDYGGENWDGTGHAYLSLGERYEGSFRDGKYEGRGSIQYRNGDRYTGEFSNGTRQGSGECKFANGDEYNGEYQVI